MAVPSGCGTAEEFEAELRRRFDREVDLPPIALTITPGPERHHLRLSVGQESRELEDVDCRALFRAAVVVTATIVLSASEPQPAPTNREPPAQPPPAEPPRRALPFKLGASLGVGVHVGLVPSASGALELEGRALFANGLGFGLAGQYVASSSRQDDPEHGVTIDAWGGRAFGVYRPSPYLLTRLGAAAFLLDGTGMSEGGPGSDTAWAAGPSAGVCFVPLPRAKIWLGIGGELYWNLLQPKFEILHYGEIFASSWFSGALFLSIGPHQP